MLISTKNNTFQLLSRQVITITNRKFKYFGYLQFIITIIT